MRLREFFAEVKALPVEAREFPLFLAMPDVVEGDDIDVQLVQIGQVKRPDEGSEILLIPASAEDAEASPESCDTLEALLRVLPSGLLDEDDVRVAVELPLDREKPGHIHLSVTDIWALHVGVESQEVWVLLRPQSEFPPNGLPA